METERLKSLAISDTGFIFDPSTGDAFNTNALGIEIISHLKGGKDMDEILDTLLGEYEVTENELEADLIDFIRNLKTFYLVS